MVRAQLIYHPAATRGPGGSQGRLTDLLDNGRMRSELGLPDLDPEHDRAMICGGPAVIQSLRAILSRRGFSEGASSRPGSFVDERAFVQK